MLRMSDMSESALMELLRRRGMQPAPSDAGDAGDATAEAAGAGDLDVGAEAESAPCDDVHAPHDLAALREGQLSSDGIRRLAAHVRRCATCQLVVATVVAETTRADSTDTQVTSQAARRRGE